MVNALFYVSFYAGLIPACLLFLFYGLRIEWYKSRMGKILFALFAVTMASYVSGALALIWPNVFQLGMHGLWIRMIIRTAIAVVLWALFYMMIVVQRVGHTPDEEAMRVKLRRTRGGN